MPKRPIILFGQPNMASRAKRHGGPDKIQYPTHGRQIQRLAPKMTNLQNAVLKLTQTSAAIEVEKTLVFDVIGDVESFYTAIKNFGDNIEWIFDVSDEFETDEDFFTLKSDGTRADDALSGKVYCVLSNVRAMEEILSLWKLYSQDEDVVFPHGKTGLKYIFKHLRDIRFWGYKERIEETNILEFWQEELQDPHADKVHCELELFFRKDEQKRIVAEAELKDKIRALGGEIISSSVIPDIAYHSILASIPRAAAEDIINGNKDVSIVIADQIMFFRPVGQAVAIQDTYFDGDFIIPPSEEISDEPIIALFDGLPQENHPYLQGRLIVDDPDNYAAGYVADARKHGTSMASIIAHGDLSETTHTTTHKIYVRPIMRPYNTVDGFCEEIPSNSLLVDKIHVAVRRLFEADAEEVAPSIKIINLSIGITYRQFDRIISPLARLLDWLSWKYRVLFIVSAGNHIDDIGTGMNFSDFSNSTMKNRDNIIIKYINRKSRNLRLLSPAESISALTVGATFEDSATLASNMNINQTIPCSDGLPSAYSAIGMGLNRAVKPDILYPGGRSYVRMSVNRGKNSTVKWPFSPTNKPGIASAAPLSIGGMGNKIMYTYGTSNAAALISHEASRCYDTLLDMFQNENEQIPDAHLALLIKAMLVHGAEWGFLANILAISLELKTRRDISNKLHRYLGYGKPDINRAIECTKNRITLIGYGDLKIEEALLYDLPLPFDFSTKNCRRLTATLVYFPPTVSTRQKYRATNLWFTIENGIKNLLDSRVDIDWQATNRGTVQHEIYENDEAVIWDEEKSIQIKVSCRGDADEKCLDITPYALMVSFEIKDAIDIDVYARIAEKITPRIKV
ncbi:hypothetical protein BEQ56_09230 [Anaerolineaceae bacterium oral taxon 439]|nr:hypothetical protein BEQ56_09230 [Anaerolineaceae bacterium oral taxon 439]